ncbi:hypothetical protein [Christiangramia sp.]|uniref:hypothetical protein n=1 Tax=Christiangramia sp. TaxID=1931228 RepID=UPI00260B7F7B|nr:hypothetical protein [Christiangramia sp.]
MKINLLFLALFLAVLMRGQESETTENNTWNVQFCIGDSLRLGEKSIKFKKLISDSRCPKGDAITCIWAGEVIVLMEFYQNGKLQGAKQITGSNILLEDIYIDGKIVEKKIPLKSNISISEFFDEENLAIKALVVSPYPTAGRKISSEEYRLDLIISEKVKTD